MTEDLLRRTEALKKRCHNRWADPHCSDIDEAFYSEAMQVLAYLAEALRTAIQQSANLKKAIDPRGALTDVNAITALAEAHQQDSESVDSLEASLASVSQIAQEMERVGNGRDGARPLVVGAWRVRQWAEDLRAVCGPQQDKS